MKFNIIILILSGLLLLSCNGSLREDGVDQLKNNDKKSSQQNIVFVDSLVFLQLLKSLPNDAMRREGVQKINSLHLKYPHTKDLPLKSIVNLFDSLIVNNPLQAHDKLLFELSKAYEIVEKNKSALNALNKLISLYPAVNYLDEVQFRKANVLYVLHRFSQAEQAYKQVIAFRNSAYYEQAVYKQGRSQFKQARYGFALNSFMHLLDVHSRDGDLVFKRMNQAEAVFIEKVMQAINQSFDAMSGPASARSYFSKKQKRKYEYHVFVSLAQFYQQKSDISDAVKTYRLFVAMNELNIQSPGFLLKVMSLYKKHGFDNEFLESQKDFVLRYPVTHVYWRLHPKNKTMTAFVALNKNLAEIANRYYLLSKRTQAAPDYRQSQRWNLLFLYSFENDIKAQNIRLQLAESLQGNRMFELAALQYDSVAYDYKKYSKSSRAAYAALIMYKKNVQELFGFEKKYGYKLYIDSISRFVEEFPEYAKTKNIKAGLNNAQYVSGDYDAAFKLLGQRKWQQAATAFEQLRGNVFQQKLQIEITKKLALIYVKTSQYKKAVRELQQISYYNDENNRQNNALWLAAELAELNSDYKLAIKLYTSYMKRFTYPLQRSIEAMQRLIEIYDRTEKPLLATQWRVQLVNMDAKGGIFRTQQTRYLAAKARFVLAKPLEDNYLNASLHAPLNKNLEIKTKLLNDTLNAYKTAASYKVAQVLTVVTYRMAELNDNFYQAIMQSVRPDDLNESEKNKYDVRLNEKAQPFRKEAIRLHQVNVSRKADGLHDGWVLKSAERLDELL